MPRKIVIVGGVGGGATVAAQIRRNDKNSEIIIFDKGGYISYANCGIPYYLGDVVQNRKDLLYPPEKFTKKYNVSVHTNTEVISISRSDKTVHYRKGKQVQEETFDKLILSPGASAIVPDIEGINNNRTFTAKTIEDMDAVHAFIQQNTPRSVAVVGAGFIGLEMIENLHALGLNCTIIDRSSQVSKIIDDDMAAIVEEHLKDKGIEVILNDGLKGFKNDGKTLLLNSGIQLEADMTILAIGIKPNTDLAINTALELGSTGAISVNEYMQTTDPDIYALGDAVETRDLLTGSPRHIALAWLAHRQAAIIAAHLDGEQIPYRGNTGSSILKVFDLTVAATGHNRQSLQQEGKQFENVVLASTSHANYYPGSKKLWLKLFFHPETGLIFGGNIVGYDGVDKRMAVLATAIKGNLTVNDLPELELGYAPPYSSSKDPINILGYKAIDMLKK
ncbi:CoA-disulfide reductase [Oceanobacillus profundus]|uniref:CoA-disulfide reductase n=1 Tax=Oceanobacillus TaxID=182709 RepID=UPI0026E19CE5|nr:CoA-disulfide reductase [Oceanobacillus profundus]MDO6448780.1 CoA-disulfide reductase [Oceanobacillus profundus]